MSYYSETDQPIDLHDDKTLIGYGRRQHGLNGKDADLDHGGQNAVESAWWFDDHIEIKGHRYASIVPPEESTDDDSHYQVELVCDCGYPGEWDGDYWVLGEDYSLNVPFTCEDSDAPGEKERALETAYQAIRKDSEAFENRMAELAKAIEDSVIHDEEGLDEEAKY